MRRIFGTIVTILMPVLFALAAVAMAQAQIQGQAPVSILADLDPASATGIRIEGLAADKAGNLYTSDLDSRRFYRVNAATGAVTVVGTLPRPASGMALDAAGNLYLASGDVILRMGADTLTGSAIAAGDVITYATGVPGANGLAFGPGGELYVSGGATGNIYVVASNGMTRTWASGFISEREAQRISTNGLAFGPDGLLYSSNTGTGAIDRIALNADGTSGRVERVVTNPLLLGADGITFAANGDLYVAANERNAIVRVARDGTVSDVASNGNAGPLEFPASPSFVGNALYASNFDISRGANEPNTGGIGASIAKIEVGVEGAPLPASAAAQPTSVPGTPAPPATTAVATIAPSTPTAMATATLPVPEATPTAEPEPPVVVGMPRTGQGSDMLPLTLALAAVAGALALGFVARRASRTR